MKPCFLGTGNLCACLKPLNGSTWTLTASLPVVEQQADSKLRGRPIGIVPFTNTEQNLRHCLFAAKPKLLGVQNVMTVGEARRLCPDILLVPQKPDLYRRAHNTLLAEIESVIPIDAVKSIDELTCKLDRGQRSQSTRLSGQAESDPCRLCWRVHYLLNRVRGQSAIGKDCMQGGQAQWRDHLAATGFAGAAFQGHAGGYSWRWLQYVSAAVEAWEFAILRRSTKPSPSICGKSGTTSRASAFGMPCTAMTFKRRSQNAACLAMAGCCHLKAAP